MHKEQGGDIIEIFSLVAKIGLDDREFNVGVEKSRNSFASFGESLFDIGDKIAGVGQSLTTKFTTPILNAAKTAVEFGMSFEQGLSKIAAITGATTEEMSGMEKAARSMSKEFGTSSVDIINAFQFIAETGGDVDSMLADMRGSLLLTQASGENFGKITESMASMMKSFGSETVTSEHIANVMAATISSVNTTVMELAKAFEYTGPIAGVLGYAIDDVAIALGLMAESGITADKAGTALREMLTVMAGGMITVAKGAKYSEEEIATLSRSMVAQEDELKKSNERTLAEKKESFEKSYNALKKSLNDEMETLLKSQDEKVKGLQKVFDEENTLLKKSQDERLREYQKSLDNEASLLKKSQDEKVRDYQRAFDEETYALNNKIDDQQRALKKSFDAELNEFEKMSNEKLSLIDKEYRERLKLVDEEKYNRLKAIDDEISNIKKREAAEVKSVRERENANKLAELNARIAAAETDEARMKALNDLSAFEEKLRLEKIKEERTAQIEILNEQKKAITEESKTKAEALKEQYENKKSSLKDEISAEKSAIKEVQSDRQAELKKTQEFEKKTLKETQTERLSLLKETNEEEAAALKELHSEKVATFKEGQEFERKTLKETQTERLSLLKDANEEESKALKELHSEKVELVKEGYAEEQKELKNSQTARLDSLKEIQKAEKSNLNELNDEKLRLFKKEQDESLKSIKEIQDKKLAVLVDSNKETLSEMKGAMNEVEIATVNLDGSMRPLNDVIMDLQREFGDLNDSQKAAAAEAIVGKSAMSGFLAVVSATTEDMDWLTESIYGSQDAFDGQGQAAGMAAKQNDNLASRVNNVKSQLQDLALDAFQILLPYMEKAVEWVTNLVKWFGDLDDGGKKTVLTILGIVAGLGPLVTIIGTLVKAISVVTGIVKGIAAAQAALNAVMLANPIMLVVAAVAALVVGITALVVWLAKEETSILSTQKAAENLQKAKENLTNTIKALETATDSYVVSIEKAAETQRKLKETEDRLQLSGKALAEQVENGTLKYRDMTAAQLEVYAAYVENEAVQNALSNSSEALTSATADLTAAKKEEVRAHWDNELALAAAKKDYASYRDSVIDAYQKGGISAENAQETLSKAMTGMSKKTRETFTQDMPKDITEGLNPKHYETTGQKITNWFKNVGNDMVSGFKKVFKINSPSKVMLEIGDNIYKGIENGVNKTNDMQKIGKNLMDGLKKGIEKGKNAVVDAAKKVGTAVTDGLKNPSGIEMEMKRLAEGIVDNAESGRDVSEDVAMLHALRNFDAVMNDIRLNAPGALGDARLIEITQNIQAVPQTPSELAAATVAAFQVARWHLA